MEYNRRSIEIFTQGFLKGWQHLTEQERDNLYERKYLLDKNFLFTEEIMHKLKVINSRLQQEEIKIRQQSDKMISLQEEWVAKKLIDDYEFNAALYCWNTGFYEQWHAEFEDNAFFSDDCFIHFGKDQDEKFYSDNWNVFIHRPEHPLANEIHCYTFHHLYDHTPLAWEDIVRIEEIWIELKVQSQFFIQLNDSKRVTD